ncbi:hypothetical protein [Streptomyces benahoarensis]|uniref:Uncharacterized protein n=1 Tax=Streptomyces benahoarensis TaxID=2595054 RepID=A0A553ZJC3_9ACTN|nr:hypothetical protein [Streptomyces benahoarensis]TSB21869.1 hypothetical protein FNJ62_17240 [Streptomyces benahoarensis]TSB41564.1 hypothetical protein FNZ23_12445 [Streptomyces benahoarensis]
MNVTFGGFEPGFDDPMALTIGTPPELWLGVPGESEEERLARLSAAADILAEEPGLMDLVTRTVLDALKAETPDLLAHRRRRTARTDHRPHAHPLPEGLAS